MEDFDLDAMVDQCIRGLGSSSSKDLDASPQPSGARGHAYGDATGSSASRAPQERSSFVQHAKRLFQAAVPKRAQYSATTSAAVAYGDRAASPPTSLAIRSSQSAGAGAGGAIEVSTRGVDLTSSPSGGGPTSDATLRRIHLWAERRQAKRAKLVYDQLEDEMKECTFHPMRDTVHLTNRRLSPNHLYKDNRAWGYDEFVDRLVTARQQREQRALEDEARIAGATGNQWTPEPTVPEPFEFARMQRRPIPSLKKHYDSIAPVLRDVHFQTMSTIEAPSVPSGLFSIRPSHVIMEHSSPKR